MQQSQKNMNQRASHFKLGNVSQEAASIYTIDYTKKKTEIDSEFKAQNPFRGSSINNTGKTNFSTTNNAMYKNWGTGEHASLDKDKLKDLRAHHFNLGTYNPTQSLTTNQHYLNAKQISSDARKNQEQSKNRMRAHYHDFKEQPYTNFKTTYGKQFAAKQSQPQGNIKPQSSQNAIVFGNHHLPMQTTNNADFNRKEGHSNQVKSPLQQSSSLVLGDKSQSMETTNQMYFNQKPILKTNLPESTMKQLRNTHFSLGGGQNHYHTQTSSNYAKHQNGAHQGTQKSQNHESGTWVPKNAKFDGRTTNQRELPNYQVNPFTKACPQSRQGFSLGNQGNHYSTESSQNFNPKQYSYTGKVLKPEDHVTTGFQKGIYDTEHRSQFKNRNLKQGKYEIDIAAKSKIDNFSIGGDHDQNITVYQDEYRRDQANKSKLFHKDNV